MKKGISVWSMNADWSYEKMFTEAAAAGFAGVEIALGSNGLTMDSTDEDVLKIKETAEKAAPGSCILNFIFLFGTKVYRSVKRSVITSHTTSTRIFISKSNKSCVLGNWLTI